jgi:hypothetical protein
VTLEWRDYEELSHLRADSTLEEVLRVRTKFEEAFEQGQGDAGYLLGSFVYAPDSPFSDRVKAELGASHEKAIDYLKRAYSVLMRQALVGDGRAMHFIAGYYQSGIPPVSCDVAQYELWIRKSREAGYKGAGGQL